MMPSDEVGHGPSMLAATIDRVRREHSYASYSALANLVDDASVEGYPRYRIAILRSFTIEPLIPVIEAQVLLAGRRPETYICDFDTISTEALNPQSGLYSHTPDLIVIARWLDTVSPKMARTTGHISEAEVEAEIDRIVQDTADVIQAIRRQTRAPILINNFPAPSQTKTVTDDLSIADRPACAITRLNAALEDVVQSIVDVYWVDYVGLFARNGYDIAFDMRNWKIAAAPFSRNILCPLGAHYGALVRALLGQAKKCLVLDCDGTLWGGIVGEDGMDGIEIGPAAPGSAYQSLQQEVLDLRSRGILLAICSKNNEADVSEVLNHHPGMMLKEKHFVCMQVNWDDKASNLKRIAEELNIGTDALVFVDDSGFECDFVRHALPEVEVLHLTGEPADFRAMLADRCYFANLTVSAEDAKRSDMMAAEKFRKRMAESATSVEDYLHGLEIKAEIARPKEAEIPRVAQLTQKTNQFNLTTRRYTEGDIIRLLADPNMVVLHLKLRDKVADIGLIGVALCKVDDAQETMEIDTLLMSCRALGRGAEDALMASLLERATSRGVKEITGTYIPTKKNAQVEGLYERFGFSRIGNAGDGIRWQLPVETGAITPPDWIEVSEKVDGD